MSTPLAFRATANPHERSSDWFYAASYVALLLTIVLGGFCGSSLSLCPMRGPGHEVAPPFFTADAGMDIC
jgi:hypothetical protein